MLNPPPPPQPRFSHGNHPPGSSPACPRPGTEHLHRARMVSLLLEGEHKSFKAANDFFFFFLFWVKEMDLFFFATLFSVAGMARQERTLFCALQTPPVQLSRNLLPSLPWPLHTPVFLAVWFFWRVLCVRGDV